MYVYLYVCGPAVCEYEPLTVDRKREALVQSMSWMVGIKTGSLFMNSNINMGVNKSTVKSSPLISS